MPVGRVRSACIGIVSRSGRRGPCCGPRYRRGSERRPTWAGTTARALAIKRSSRRPPATRPRRAKLPAPERRDRTRATSRHNEAPNGTAGADGVRFTGHRCRCPPGVGSGWFDEPALGGPVEVESGDDAEVVVGVVVGVEEATVAERRMEQVPSVDGTMTHRCVSSPCALRVMTAKSRAEVSWASTNRPLLCWRMVHTAPTGARIGRRGTGRC